MPIRSPRLALLAACLAPAAAGAQALALPSGLTARLYDVVLEAATGLTAPDAFTDPEGEEGQAAPDALGDAPLDMAPDLAPDPDSEAPAPLADDPLGTALEPAAAEGGLARFRLVVERLGQPGADYDTVAADFGWLCASLALPALAANGWSPTEVVIALSDRETPFGVLDPEAVQFYEGFRIEGGACVPQAF